jgi:hypothetical protein
VRSWNWRIGSWPAAARTWPWRARGIYWRPVYQILEERQLTVLLVNAAHVKKVPGRKTDVKDGEWIAELLEHSLLRGSFVPPAPLRKLRELTRARCQLIDIHSEEANRAQKFWKRRTSRWAMSQPTYSVSRDGPEAMILVLGRQA